MRFFHAQIKLNPSRTCRLTVQVVANCLFMSYGLLAICVYIRHTAYLVFSMDLCLAFLLSKLDSSVIVRFKKIHFELVILSNISEYD